LSNFLLQVAILIWYTKFHTRSEHMRFLPIEFLEII